MDSYKLPSLESELTKTTPRPSTGRRPGFSLFRPGLQFKLLQIVIGVSLIGVLVSSLLVLTLQRQQLIDSSEAATTRLSNAIEASLGHAMLVNDWTHINQMVQDVVVEENVERIRIIDAQGNVHVSSQPAELGERLDRAEPECQFCHAEGYTPNSKTAIVTSEAGEEALVNVNLIPNQPQCAECHDPRSEVLGLLVIEAPLTDLRDQLAAGLSRLVLSALASFLLLVGLMVLALRRYVIQPVDELAKGVAEITGGNLDYQVPVTSQDELGELATSFDTMRQQLKISRAKMQRRNRELSVLNEVALAAGQSLDLQQVLDLALGTVVDKLEIQAGAITLLEETGRFAMHASRGLSESQCQEIERRRQQPTADISQQVFETGEAVFVEDMAADSRFEGMWDSLRGSSFVSVPLTSKGEVVGTMALTSFPGQPLTKRAVQVLEVVGREIGMAIDNALLLAETSRREQEAVALYQLGRQVSGSLELKRVLNAVADGARQLLAADVGVVGLVDEPSKEVLVKATSGTPAEALKDLSIPIRKGTPGSALASGQPLIVERCQSDLMVLRGVDPSNDKDGASFLAVPLERGGHLAGLVGVMTQQYRRFSNEDVRRLTRLAHHVVVAIENAQLYQQVSHLVVLEERDRLARELHDYLAQALGYLNLKISITGDLMAGAQFDQAQTSLLELKQIAREAYTDVRETIFSLRTAASSGLGLLPTLREYLAEYQLHYGVAASLVADKSSVRFSPEVDTQVLRIIQEALTNVRKHARASHTWVRFDRNDGQVRITIEDDGQGFDPVQVAGEGRRYFGLQIMRERAESVGGSLEFDSRPGKGTRVVIQVPSIS
jgi:nitrate/nitrite-specific signal transduction histidine kinase